MFSSRTSGPFSWNRQVLVVRSCLELINGCTDNSVGLGEGEGVLEGRSYATVLWILSR